ncbi:25864_t:CDS:2, partial [Racocetra persica]
ITKLKPATKSYNDNSTSNICYNKCEKTLKTNPPAMEISQEITYLEKTYTKTKSVTTSKQDTRTRHHNDDTKVKNQNDDDTRTRMPKRRYQRNDTESTSK